MNRPIGPLPLHPTVQLTGLTRAHTTALVTAAAEAGETVFATLGHTTTRITPADPGDVAWATATNPDCIAFAAGDRWAITTPENSFIGGTATTANWVFGEAWESPAAWLDRHIDRHPAHTRTGRLLRTVQRRVLTAADAATSHNAA